MKLMPYQEEGAEFLASRRYAFLADGMGLGKSAQAIVAADKVGARQVVVICPAVAVINWQREFELWSLTRPQLFVVSYDKATRPDIKEKIKSMQPDVLIIDEAHYAKTRTAKRTCALYGKHCVGNGIANHSHRVWLLTGTPCPNNAGELYSHLRALWPETIMRDGKPSNYADFIHTYCQVIDTQFGPKILGNKNTAELKAILRNLMIRRKAEDVLKDLPPIFWQSTVVEADHVLHDVRQLEQEPAVEALSASLQKGDINLEEMGVAMASLRRVTGLAKAKLAARMVADELQNHAYEKIVVFVQHTEVGKTLIQELAKFGVVSISGTTTTTQRQNAIDQFQTNPKVRVFIGQLQACSTAITLHAANQVLFVEQSWTPADNAQAAKRCHRIGQKKPVIVRMLGLAKSIDEFVAKVLTRKSQMIAEILE